MEPLVFLPMILSMLIPMMIVFVVYAAVIALVIWFVVSFLKIQKERNAILLKMSKKMDGWQYDSCGGQDVEVENQKE
jgi:uncharacterized membrane protein YqiK